MYPRGTLMLFTRCPDCQTNFRITVSALGKADGKVRCGRCDAIFSATDELQELRLALNAPPASEEQEDKVVTEWSMDRPQHPDSFVILHGDDVDSPELPKSDSDEDQPAAVSAIDVGPSAEDDQTSATENDEWATFFAKARLSSAASGNAAAESDALAEDIQRADELDDDEDEQLDSALGDQLSADDPAADYPAETFATDDSGLTAEQIDVTLSDDLDLESRLVLMEPESEQSGRRSRLWFGGVIVMAAVFALQATHYYRGELANRAIIGPLLQSIYRVVGMPITPEWDLTQYEILDLVATATPGAAGEDTLNISARIRNNGPRAQPYPSIRLALKDRWEQTVGSRIFAPAAYLPEGQPADGLMTAGVMAPIILDVADRSDDAYGFELDVCVEAPAGSIACQSDVVFE